MLQVPIDAVGQKEAFAKAVSFFQTDGLKKIYTPNPEIVMLAQTDPLLKTALEEGDLVVPDGIGLIIASKVKGKGLKERVAGIDLLHKILIHCGQTNRSVYLFGGKPGVAESAAYKMHHQYPGINVAGFRDGYFKEEETPQIIEDINQSGAHLLLVGLGAPKQEHWIHQYQDRLQCRVVMGVGGSIDVYAGTAKRAPLAYQRLGLEWFYRLVKEPRRYKRMLLLPKFLVQFVIKG